MKSFKLIFPFLLLFLMATVAEAQQEGTPDAGEAAPTIEAPAKKEKRTKRGGAHRKAHYERMVTQLNLSDAQKEKFNAVNKDYRKKMQDAKANSGDDRAAMRKAMKQVRDEQAAELKNILTKEQFMKYEALQKEQRGKREGKRGQFGPGGR